MSKGSGDVSERLIVALDVPTLEEARALVARLGDSVSFYKVGMWLFFQRGVDGLIDELTAAGKQVFLDYKMYDIGETVRRELADTRRLSPADIDRILTRIEDVP